MRIAALALAALALAPLPAGADAAAPSGQEIFLGQKCNLCHSVQAAGIAAKIQSDKNKAPDLGGTAVADDATLVPFLRGEAELAGAKHPKKITASDEEVVALLAWLRGLAKGGE